MQLFCVLELITSNQMGVSEIFLDTPIWLFSKLWLLTSMVLMRL